MVGGTGFSLLPEWVGGRGCGEIMGYGIAFSLGAAALFFDRTIFGYPAFVVLLIPAALFFDGGFSNIAPYSAEIFPVRLSARGVGLAQRPMESARSRVRCASRSSPAHPI